ncbi:hypothetical protein HPB52_004696 [Rhipicephalus sanguineus]|uniref:Uncharacterized protein n=1 Tax=Rhipicephalus sanguineus TaxID=34632 RepID=A0A9D4QKX6_RHISA|nr:hypothetical protein HPB52_004696 [Rhipicephalus sanguineus]
MLLSDYAKSLSDPERRRYHIKVAKCGSDDTAWRFPMTSSRTIGLVEPPRVKTLRDGNIVVVSKVRHSQAFKEKPLLPWLLIKPDGWPWRGVLTRWSSALLLGGSSDTPGWSIMHGWTECMAATAQSSPL